MANKGQPAMYADIHQLATGLNKFRHVTEGYNVSPENIYNMDATGLHGQSNGNANLELWVFYWNVIGLLWTSYPRESQHILICGGHGSHNHAETVAFCMEPKILLILSVSHSSHVSAP